MQTRLMSFTEAVTNVLVGYGLGVLTQVLVFPLFAIEVSIAETLEIGLVFTTVSIARSYALRRLFGRLGQRVAP